MGWVKENLELKELRKLIKEKFPDYGVRGRKVYNKTAEVFHKETGITVLAVGSNFNTGRVLEKVKKEALDRRVRGLGLLRTQRDS